MTPLQMCSESCQCIVVVRWTGQLVLCYIPKHTTVSVTRVTTLWLKQNQVLRYPKQYIIPCDLCYDVTFLNSSMPQKPVCSVKIFFLCKHPVYKTRIYFRQEWLVYVMRMHSMWYVQTYLSKRLLNYYLPPWPIPYVELRGPTRCLHI